MKRFMLLIICFMLLTSCGSIQTDDETLYYTYPSSLLAYKNGIFEYADGLAVMKFLDFDSMESVPICPKPNCPHTDYESCSALGIGFSNFVYNDKLWWFDSDLTYGKNNEILEYSTLYSADVDGTNRMKVAVLDEFSVLSSSIYVKNGKAYFEAMDLGWDNERGVSTNYDKVFLYSYDFGSKKFTEICAVKEGYHAGIYIFGRYENSLVLKLDDGVENKSDPGTQHYMFYDFDSGEFTECDKVIYCAQKDWLITIEDDGTIVVNRAYSDEEYRITDERFTQAFWGGYCVFDEMLMCTTDGLAYELKTGKIRTTQICGIRAYYKGKYIVNLMNSAEYVAVTKKELFTD